MQNGGLHIQILTGTRERIYTLTEKFILEYLKSFSHGFSKVDIDFSKHKDFEKH